jgi:hypothetical protein
MKVAIIIQKPAVRQKPLAVAYGFDGVLLMGSDKLDSP